MTVSVGTATGDPVTSRVDPTIGSFQGEGLASGDIDNRGVAQPTEAQRSLAGQQSTTVRWNRYGTPATLMPKADTQQKQLGVASDPVSIARGYLMSNTTAFGLTSDSINNMDVLVSRPMGEGSYVMLRQRFGATPSALDGLAAFGIHNGQVVYLSSTLSPDGPAPGPATLTPGQALEKAATDAGLTADELTTTRVSLGAIPMPGAAPRAAYQVVVVGQGQADMTGYTTYVDAQNGQVLVRENIVDHETDNPQWDAFPANPPNDYSSTDTRVKWCLTQAPGCERTVSTANSGLAWDVNQTTGTPSQTSVGNSAINTEKWDDLAGGTVGTRTATASPNRQYTYPWTNQWFNAKCNPDVFATPQQNDIDAAITNLFAMHNRMHDWSYQLGFTEETWNLQSDNGTHGQLGGDAERGQAQSGGRAGGAPPAFPSRDNANQSSPPDGVPPVTNMYLWQSIPGSFYAPCVDGDYDMSVIGHEYTHAITGRAIAGPNSGWSGQQAGAMNESHSDLFANEYLYEYGFRPRGDTPFVTGGYVTGNTKVGIRDYDESKSPLNYSNVAFDLVGQEVHADGEIWNAISFNVRQALVDKYGLGTPALQRACADGTVPVEKCPGNRRWIQLSFDALLLSASGAVSMVDIRNAELAADMVRFGGADVSTMWNAYAKGGLGQDAASNGPNDQDPTPSFASPFARNASLRLLPAGQAHGANARLYVGDYEARSMPVADTDPATPLGDTVSLVPGTYHFLVTGAGFGSNRFTQTVRSGERTVLPAILFNNVASGAQGAVATGDGVNLPKLIDDSEATDWASLGSPVAGKEVTVKLAGDHPQIVSRVNVSAQLRPADPADTADPGGQNRFTAVRQFEILSCNAAFGQDCSNPANFRKVFTSAPNAFPAGIPRPVAPDLTIRSFRIQPTIATHLMVRVLTNQCTGTPDFAGQQHNDPRSNSDCTTGNTTVAQTVRISELEAFII